MTARELAQGGKGQRVKSRWEEKEKGALGNRDRRIPRRSVLSKANLLGHLVKNLEMSFYSFLPGCPSIQSQEKTDPSPKNLNFHPTKSFIET